MPHNNLLSVVVFSAIACVIIFAILVISASSMKDNEEIGIRMNRQRNRKSPED